jgi:hypothetical protein
MGDELELVFPGGRRIHLIESAVPLFHADGSIRGAIIAGQDITERKRMRSRCGSARTLTLVTSGTRIGVPGGTRHRRNLDRTNGPPVGVTTTTTTTTTTTLLPRKYTDCRSRPPEDCRRRSLTPAQHGQTRFTRRHRVVW